MIEGLNEQQKQAVTQPLQHVLVLAGAGSGKTRVLTTRMAWLIQSGQLQAQNLLAVTFTNKAAREMLSRLTALMPINTQGMWVGTFHGLCNRLLRAHYSAAKLPQNFQILDQADQLSAIKRLLKAKGVDTDHFPARDVQRMINAAKEDGQRPADLDVSDRHARHLADLYEAYQQQCEREGVADFAELLLRAYELLSRDATLREHYQSRFKHILVDEFQDTNILQYRWLMLLSGGSIPVFAVGDDDQSIYAFRGAHVGNMADFERRYAAGNVIRLEQNYRSQGHILDAANALIQHNHGRLGKNLWTEAGPGERLRVIEQPSDTLEAQFLADEIHDLLRQGQVAHEIALLYRSNAQSRALEHALFSAQIPYRVYGGLRFFERQEVKHVLAYLRLVDNLDDDTAWLRVVNFPTRGIGARSQQQLSANAQQYGISLAAAVPYVSGKAGASFGRFLGLISQLRHAAESLDLPELIGHVIHHSGLEAHYQAEREGQERLENLQELVNAALAFANEASLQNLPAAQLPEGGEMSPLGAFLSHATLEAGDNQAQAGTDAVQLMTVHAAKGLEFDCVYITGMEEGLFPHENSLLDSDGLQEERRLMYVALTRARQRLSLSLAQSRMLHGQTRYALRSRFLDEIPEEHLQWLGPRQKMPEQNTWGGAFRRGLGGWQTDAGKQFAPRSPRSQAMQISVGGQIFDVGSRVSHDRFGEGTVLSLSGSGADAQARIEFAQVGTKTLALAVAKLKVLD